ncbi:hypothetical protein ILYODFUR_023904, partial [Ilyodon furcidens]
VDNRGSGVELVELLHVSIPDCGRLQIISEFRTGYSEGPVPVHLTGCQILKSDPKIRNTTQFLDDTSTRSFKETTLWLTFQHIRVVILQRIKLTSSREQSNQPSQNNSVTP